MPLLFRVARHAALQNAMQIPIPAIGDMGATRQGVTVTSFGRCTFLYLTNGRVFIRGEDGAICEADAWERNRATILLGAQRDGTLNPVLSMELLPPTDS